MSKSYLIYFFFIGIIVLTAFATSLIIALFRYRQKIVKHKNELLHSRIEAQEQSMKLISEEIHDNIGQLLSLARIHTQSISGAADNGILKPMADKLHQLLTNVIGELRFISHSLNGDRMQQIGLHSSLERELEQIEVAATIRSRFIIVGDNELNTEQNLLIFRVMQEVIQNMIKHAEASIFIVIFTYSSTGLHIGIKDDGIGFDVEGSLKKGNLGMRNIQNRVALMKGKIEFISKERIGTKIKIHIPKNYGK